MSPVPSLWTWNPAPWTLCALAPLDRSSVPTTLSLVSDTGMEEFPGQELHTQERLGRAYTGNLNPHSRVGVEERGGAHREGAVASLVFVPEALTWHLACGLPCRSERGWQQLGQGALHGRR